MAKKYSKPENPQTAPLLQELHAIAELPMNKYDERKMICALLEKALTKVLRNDKDEPVLDENGQIQYVVPSLPEIRTKFAKLLNISRVYNSGACRNIHYAMGWIVPSTNSDDETTELVDSVLQD